MSDLDTESPEYIAQMNAGVQKAMGMPNKPIEVSVNIDKNGRMFHCGFSGHKLLWPKDIDARIGANT